MSPRAKREDQELTGDALRQAIREEIERQMGPPQWACPDCPDSFLSQAELLAHDIDAHLPERVVQADRRLRERKGKV